MKKVIVYCSLIVLLALVATTTFAGPGFGPGYGRGDCQDCEVAKWNCDHHPGGAIDLSDDQRASIESIRAEEREKLEPLRAEIQKLRIEMRQAMENEAIDEARLRQLARDKADKKVDLKILKQQFRSRAEAILPPEQVEQLKERREWRQEHRAPHSGKKGFRGKGDCGNCYNKPE